MAQRNISIPTSEPPEALQNKGMSCSLPILSKARDPEVKRQVPLIAENTHMQAHTSQHTHPHAPLLNQSLLCAWGLPSPSSFILENKGF